MLPSLTQVVHRQMFTSEVGGILQAWIAWTMPGVVFLTPMPLTRPDAFRKFPEKLQSGCHATLFYVSPEWQIENTWDG